MTDQERLIFREVVDLNWEFEHESDWKKKFDIAQKLNQKKKELINSMGKKEYDKFIELGRQMFAPKKETVDSDYEEVFE